MAKPSEVKAAELKLKQVSQNLGCEETADFHYQCDLQGKMVFALIFHKVNGEMPCTGYPLYYFVDPDDPNKIFSKSDADLEITRQIYEVRSKQQAAKTKAKAKAKTATKAKR